MTDVSGILNGVDRWSTADLIGRQAERTRLRDALSQAEAGQVRVVLVAGEAGIGKSRLVAAFTGDAEQAGARVLAGGCLDVGEGVLPYAPLIEAFRGLVSTLPEARFDEVFGDGRGDLGRLLPELATTTAQPAEAAPAGRLFEQFLGTLTRLAATQPVVLVVEDVHWADRSTMDLLTFLERNLRAPVLLLLTVRSDELHRGHPVRSFLVELDRRGKLVRIDLGPFDRRATTELVTALLGRPPSPRFVGQVFERSEGNPFHVEMLVAAGPDGHRRLPDRLRDVLVGQIDALPPAAQRVLRIAAVAGRRVDAALLVGVARATATDPEEVTSGLREAVSQHLLVADARDEQYAFRHALLQEAVYDDMLPDERSRMHAELARVLEGQANGSGGDAAVLGELAHHWFAAHHQERALVAAVAAAQAAIQSFAHAEAVVQFDRALTLWDGVTDADALTGMQRREVLIAAGQAAWFVGEPARAAKHLRVAISLTDRTSEPLLVAEQLLRLAWFLYFGAGTQDEGDAVVREAADLVPEEPPTSQRSAVLSALAYLALRDGEYERIVTLSRQALAVARAVEDDPLRRLAQGRLGSGLVLLGQVDEGVEQALASLQPPKGLEFYRIGQIYINCTDALMIAGRTDDVVKVGREGVRVGLRLGARTGFVTYILGNVAEALIDAGRWDEAQVVVDEALEMDPGITGERFVRQLHARLLFARGHEDLAHHEWDDLLAIGGQDDPQLGGPMGEWLAACWLAEDDVDQARQAIDDGVRWVRGNLRFLVGVVARGLEVEEAARERGYGDAGARADRLIGTLRTRMAEQPGIPPRFEAMALVAEARLLHIHGAPDPSAWSKAVDLFETLGMPPSATVARLGRAQASLAVGDRPGAAEDLRAAWNTALQMGARLLQDKIQGLATRAHVTVDKTARTDSPTRLLTRREHEVMALLGTGSTNRQIANRLFISEKTASVHVSNILAKLGVENRGQAVAEATRRGLL